MLSFKMISIIHKQEDGFKRAIISGRKSNKKFLKEIISYYTYIPSRKDGILITSHINFTTKPYQIIFTYKIFYITQYKFHNLSSILN